MIGLESFPAGECKATHCKVTGFVKCPCLTLVLQEQMTDHLYRTQLLLNTSECLEYLIKHSQV